MRIQLRQHIVIPIGPSPILAAYSRQQPESKGANSRYAGKTQMLCQGLSIFPQEGCGVVTVE
jgi:hypothetical protein